MAGRAVSQLEWESIRPRQADSVSIRNLRAVANAGYDVWGRPRTQPVEMSVKLLMSQPVSTAAAADKVNEATVHYGQLSKALLAQVELLQHDWQRSDTFVHLMAAEALNAAPLPSLVAAVECEVNFVKSSLFGAGWSLRLQQVPDPAVSSLTFCLHDCRIPALIGVNSHERLMKQTVVVSVWIDRLQAHLSDECYQVEQIVSKTVDESSHETLESLCESVAASVTKYFILAKRSPGSMQVEPAGVRVRIEKPSAVPMAEAPAVEIYRSAEADEAFGKRMMAELGSKRPQIPFPLQGRLDEFLQSWKQD